MPSAGKRNNLTHVANRSCCPCSPPFAIDPNALSTSFYVAFQHAKQCLSCCACKRDVFCSRHSVWYGIPFVLYIPIPKLTRSAQAAREAKGGSMSVSNQVPGTSIRRQNRRSCRISKILQDGKARQSSRLAACISTYVRCIIISQCFPLPAMDTVLPLAKIGSQSTTNVWRAAM